MGAERSPSVISRKSTSLNLHPVRFSYSQLFGMAPGEDGEEEASFRKLHGVLTMDMFTVRKGCGLGKLPLEFIF